VSESAAIGVPVKRVLWLAAGMAACSAPPPDESSATSQDPTNERCVLDFPQPDDETEHLLVFNETGGPICSGTFRALDLEVERLVQELGLSLDAPLPIYYGLEPAIEMCDFDADSHWAGCAKRSGCETFIATSFYPQVHELVHGIRRRNELIGPSVLEEGIAMVLGEARPFNGVRIGVEGLAKRSMLELVELERDDLTAELYAYGAHFLSFAIEQHGLQAVTAVMADARYPNELEDLFETHLGTSLAELDERWRTEAWDTWYTSYDRCEEVVELGDGFELSATLDCQDAQTLGHFAAPLFAWPINTCLSITEPTAVSITTTGGPGTVAFGGRDCAPEDITDPTIITGRELSAPDHYETTLGRCTWWAYFRAEWDEAPTDLRLRVEPR
jgi:hypothetical protein